VEVSVVGERIGRVIGRHISKSASDIPSDDIAKVVATACLLHDIGTPPFGHEGETAIQDWADSKPCNISSLDCSNFDGNAQGFRIAVRLQGHGLAYGLNLTIAALATYLKYPTLPLPQQNPRGKVSAFNTEAMVLNQVLSRVGLSSGKRHPLTLIMEAADDIVNRLVDLEDGLKTGLVRYEEMRATVQKHDSDLLSALDGRHQTLANLPQDEREQAAFQHLRAIAAGKMAQACERHFISHLEKIEASEFSGGLVESTHYADLYKAISRLEKERIFGAPRIVRIEAAGKVVIGGLLKALSDATVHGKKLGRIVPPSPELPGDTDFPDKELHRVVDYVSGMTDGFAVRLYQEISGVAL
jgi:dGTPase